MNNDALPYFPRAESFRNCVVIVHEDGSMGLWGMEPSKGKARRVTEEIQVSISALNYVKKAIVEKLDELREDLIGFGIPDEYASHFISEGYKSVSNILLELNELQFYSDEEGEC
jgi:hypothetical protein